MKVKNVSKELADIHKRQLQELENISHRIPNLESSIITEPRPNDQLLSGGSDSVCYELLRISFIMFASFLIPGGFSI